MMAEPLDETLLPLLSGVLPSVKVRRPPRVAARARQQPVAQAAHPPPAPPARAACRAGPARLLGRAAPRLVPRVPFTRPPPSPQLITPSPATAPSPPRQELAIDKTLDVDLGPTPFEASPVFPHVTSVRGLHSLAADEITLDDVLPRLAALTLLSPANQAPHNMEARRLRELVLAPAQYEFEEGELVAERGYGRLTPATLWRLRRLSSLKVRRAAPGLGRAARGRRWRRPRAPAAPSRCRLLIPPVRQAGPALTPPARPRSLPPDIQRPHDVLPPG
jgi:hypothetical protein